MTITFYGQTALDIHAIHPSLLLILTDSGDWTPLTSATDVRRLVIQHPENVKTSCDARILLEVMLGVGLPVDADLPVECENIPLTFPDSIRLAVIHAINGD